MKTLFTILLATASLFVIGQQQTVVIYDSQGNIKSGNFIKTMPPRPVKLKDPHSNYTFILDSTHIHITAYDSAANVIWKSDPYKDNNIEGYRTKWPIIVDMQFGLSEPMNPNKGHKVLWIRYNNTQFGYLDLKTGKYFYGGQD